MLLAIWILIVLGTLLILATIISLAICAIQKPCPTGATGQSGASGSSGASGCPNLCATGITGPTGAKGQTGPMGIRGSTGMHGLDLRPITYGFLTPSIINDIEACNCQYIYEVTQDIRPDQNFPSDLMGDQSRNLLYWNSTDWQILGPYWGTPGATGPTGVIGPNGATGPTGSGVPTGFQGATGIIGFGGNTGISQFHVPSGSSFGDGRDANVTIAGTTTITQDMFYESLTVNPGAILNSNGFRIFSRQFINNNGVIQNNGTSGSFGVAGQGGKTGTLIGGADGGNSLIAPGTGGASNYALTLGPNPATPYFSGGGENTVSDGFAGQVFANSQIANLQMINAVTNPFVPQTGFIFPISGGSSGGWSDDGNGSGGGGGTICLCTYTLAGNGLVSVNGGNGSGSFGGGGGGGACIIRVVNNLSSIVFTANAGSDSTANPAQNGLVIFC